MRIVNLKSLLLGVALAAVSPLYACPDEECLWIPTTIKFPGVAYAYQLRGDHLLCVNDARRAIVVDLKNARTFDLGAIADRRLHDADIADAHALFLAKNRLQ